MDSTDWVPSTLALPIYKSVIQVDPFMVKPEPVYLVSCSYQVDMSYQDVNPKVGEVASMGKGDEGERARKRDMWWKESEGNWEKKECDLRNGEGKVINREERLRLWRNGQGWGNYVIYIYIYIDDLFDKIFHKFFVLINYWWWFY